jgi:hypothetical protein
MNDIEIDHIEEDVPKYNKLYSEINKDSKEVDDSTYGICDRHINGEYLWYTDENYFTYWLFEENKECKICRKHSSLLNLKFFGNQLDSDTRQDTNRLIEEHRLSLREMFEDLGYEFSQMQESGPTQTKVEDDATGNLFGPTEDY